MWSCPYMLNHAHIAHITHLAFNALNGPFIRLSTIRLHHAALPSLTFRRKTWSAQRWISVFCMIEYVKICYKYKYVQRKFRSRTSDNMDKWKAEMEKAEMERVREKRRVEERRSEKRKSQQKEDADARKSQTLCFFQWFGAPEGRKVGSLKRRVRSQLARWEMKNCRPLWREAHFEVEMHKAHQLRTTFGNWDVEKVHVVVARSTFRSQNVQNTPASDHFWKLRCRKSVHAAVARSTFRSQNVQNTTCTRHLWRFRCRFVWQAQGMGHLLKSEQNVKVL